MVKYNVEDDSQEFYNVADGEILCISVHQQKTLCAIGTSSAIIMVDLTTMKTLSFLNGHEIGVTSLDIDETGEFVVSVTTDSRTIMVEEWKSRTIIATSQTYGLATLDIKFINGSSTCIVECGTCFVRFWNIKGGSLHFEEVKMDSLEHMIEFYSCICRDDSNNNLLVGTSTGHIIPFDNNKPGKRLKAHKSAVTNISYARDGFISCSNDNVKLWNSSMRCMVSVSIDTEALRTKHSISSICCDDASKIFVGTTGNEVWQLLSSDDGSKTRDGKALISSHSSSPKGLSVHPNGTFATTSHDGILRVYSNTFDTSDNKSHDLMMSEDDALAIDVQVSV